MKRSILILVLILITSSMLMAQKTVIVKKVKKPGLTVTMKGDTEDMEEMANDLAELTNIDVSITKGDEDSSKPYMGVFVEDLTFPKAQELGYEHTYGLLITGVVQNSPAWDARLMEDDIIMEINGARIANSDEFDKIRSGYRVGDELVYSIFRNGKTETIKLTLGARPVKTSTPGEKTKTRLSAGYGGGTWIPMWFQTDMDDVNYVVNQLGFSNLSEDGIFMQGLGGKLPVGKGYFVGGYVTGYEYSSKTADLNDPAYHNWMMYTSTLGGVTMDKRIPLTKNLITSMGLMLGGGSHSIELMHTNADYDWDTIGADLSVNHNNRALMTKKYIVVQPRAEVMYRLLGWFGLRAEVGYTYGYAPTNGWHVEGVAGETFEIKDSPKTKFEGLNVTVGPWFGF